MSALSRHIALTLCLPISALLLGTTAALAQQQDAPPPVVTVVTLHAEEVPITTTLPGRVLASAEAEVRPQVNGIVNERLFDEGSRVRVGDPLFRIDPTTYQAAVAQAEAGLARANAEAAAAEREAQRVGALLDRRVSSEQASDNAIAARDSAVAAVKVAEAQLQTAQIELDRTTIRAELEGEIGLSQVSQGALVTAGQATPLAVIRRLDPIHVDVTQSAAEIIRFRRDMAAGGDKTRANGKVTLRLADGSDYDHEGKLTAAEPYVNETTGVVTLRLEFDNPDAILLPGMYVQAVVEQTIAKDVILAPQEGVSRDRRGQPIALVVNAQNQVEERQLTVLQDHGNTWVVSEGLNDGDRIVVEGVQRIGAGMPVTPEERGAAPAAGADGAPPAEGAATAEGAAPAEGTAPAAGEAPAEGAPAEAAPAAEAPAAEAPAPDTPTEAAPADGQPDTATN